jgi:GTP diphosphokinase / guanosine-3',5'-bis(diphosphate) 3'-diphosphatase
MVNKNPGRQQFIKLLEYKVAPNLLDYIILAYKLAKYGHKGQQRLNGVRYFEHPKKVALILIEELHVFDHEMIIAALLHDMIEDSYLLDIKDVEMIFGKRIKLLVNTLTKAESPNKFEKTLEYHYNLVKAEESAIIIKLADRLHNMRDLIHCSKKKITKQVKETEEIFIPLAEKKHPYLYKEIKKATEKAKKIL